MCDLRERVCRANKEIVEAGLVVLTWGNVSAIERESGRVAIKPSGVEYAELVAEDIVVVDLREGGVVDGEMVPSSDTPTHLEIYRAFPSVGAIVHTHSTYATSWAQAKKPIPCYGTTHADNFAGTVPVCRELNRREIQNDYERNTGRSIVECFQNGDYAPLSIPAVLVPGHGPFVWGDSVSSAVENAIVLEEVAKTAYQTAMLETGAQAIPDCLLKKHFTRKHGKDAYYGQ